MAITTLPDSPLHEVQLIIGDTDQALISASVLQYILSTNSNNVSLTATEAIKYIISDLSKRADEEVGDVKVKWTKLLENYRALLTSLLTDSSFSSVQSLPIFGGVNKTEIDRVRNNSNSNGAPLQEGFFTNSCKSNLNSNDIYSLGNCS